MIFFKNKKMQQKIVAFKYFCNVNYLIDDVLASSK